MKPKILMVEKVFSSLISEKESSTFNCSNKSAKEEKNNFNENI